MVEDRGESDTGRGGDGTLEPLVGDPAVVAGRRRMVSAIAVMVILFGVALLFRWEIRSRWWAYRLEQSAEPAERLYYVRCLSNAGNAGVHASARLLDSPDVGVRSHAVAVLNNIDSPVSLAALMQACSDDDPAVRESAVLGMSFQSSPKIVSNLRIVINGTDIDTAMLATSRLGAIDTPESLAALRELALSHDKTGVRAQAILSLSAWPADKVADVLIDCLADEAAYSGLTATERAARDVLAGAAPQFASQLDENASGGLFGPAGEPNGNRAARVLQKLTGEDFGYIEAADNDRAKAIAAWRDWWEDIHEP